MRKKKPPIGIKTEYLLMLRNTLTGEKRSIKTHNTLTTYGIYDLVGHLPYFANGYTCSVSTVYFGTGSGTPAVSDTAMFTPAFSAGTGDSNVKRSYGTMEIISENERKFNVTFVIPPSDSYSANITELGLAGGGHLYTHAMIMDSEGNPISINKTNIDELTVSVDFYVTRGDISESELVFSFDGNVLIDSYHFFEYSYSYYSYQSCLELTDAANIDYLFKPCQKAGDSAAWKDTTYSMSGCRFSTSNSPEMYVNMVAFSYSRPTDAMTAVETPSFAFRFPNTKLFPQRTLTGMSLGKGDGSTKEFTPVLPVWVKDTEVIYKNGTALTRGVDYTCDHIGNARRMQGITQGTFFRKLLQYSDKIPQANYSDQYGFFIPGTKQKVANGYSDKGPSINESTPMIISYMTDPLLGNSINTIVPGTWTCTKPNDYSSKKEIPEGTVLTYSVSEDGNTYTDVLSLPISCSYNESFSDTTDHKLDKDYVMNYLKISIKWPDGTRDKDTLGLYQAAGDSQFCHRGSGIIFTNAPAANDVLTMDAAIDRLWKSSDYIFDFNPVISFAQ
ncbi:MAG: hypothetical protein ACI4ET_09995 [Bilifractor sp.]